MSVFSFKPYVTFCLQLENIGNFIKAIQAYGMKPHDIFEANDLFENGNMTQVQTTLVALAGLVGNLSSLIKGTFLHMVMNDITVLPGMQGPGGEGPPVSSVIASFVKRLLTSAWAR